MLISGRKIKHETQTRTMRDTISRILSQTVFTYKRKYVRTYACMYVHM